MDSTDLAVGLNVVYSYLAIRVICSRFRPSYIGYLWQISKRESMPPALRNWKSNNELKLVWGARSTNLSAVADNQIRDERTIEEQHSY